MAQVKRRWLGPLGCMVGVWGIFLLSLMSAASPAVAAEDSPAGITVTGSGTAKAPPTVVVLEGIVWAEAELAGDAKVKYLDTKKKAIAALEALKDPNLSIESLGPAISQANDPNVQMQLMRGMSVSDTGKQKVRISEQIRLVLKGIDKTEPEKLIETVLKVLDTARDSGLHIGAPPPTNWYEMQARAQNGGGDGLATFKIPDKSELEKQACQAAIADARAKAQRMAELSGLKLGQVVSISDMNSVEAKSNQTRMMEAIMESEGLGSAASSPAGSVSSTVLSDISLTVHLTVRFEIAK